MGWLSGWNYRQKITIDHTLIDADLTNFPVKLIVPSGNELFNKAKPDGADMRFTASDGATLLDFEREAHLGEAEGLFFDGIDDVVFVPDSASLDISQEITLEAWVNPSQYVDHGTVCTKGAAYYLQVHSDGTVAVFTYFNDNGSKGISTYTYSNSTIPLNTWTHIAFVEQSDGTRNIYIDGVLDKTATAEASIWTNDVRLGIGGEDSLSDPRRFCGYIREVRIWNVARTQTEIQNNMDVTLTGTETGLVAYYKFDEGAGTTLTDYAGNNDGTIYGAAWNNGIAVYHVKVPFVSSTADTDIYMYYGNPSATDASNPSAVWDNDYELVMHMGPTLEDSTGNGNDGTNNGSVLGLASDGYYRSFDGVNDYIITTSNIGISGTTDRTIEIRALPNNQAKEYFLCWESTNAGEGNRLRVEEDNGSLRDEVAGGYIYGSTNIVGATKDLAVRWNGISDVTDAELFVDGIEDSIAASDSQAVNTADSKIYIGTYPTLDYFLDGNIYEIRISSTARSDAWLKITSATLRDQLLAFGAEETLVTMMLAFNF